MKAVIALLAFVAVASAGIVAPGIAIHAPTIVARAPAFDSAVIKSDRIGGNFAYSVAENHAYAAHTPVISHVTSPVAVSYSAPVVHQAIAHTYAAAPIAYSAGLFGHPAAVRVL